MALFDRVPSPVQEGPLFHNEYDIVVMNKQNDSIKNFLRGRKEKKFLKESFSLHSTPR